MKITPKQLKRIIQEIVDSTPENVGSAVDVIGDESQSVERYIEKYTTAKSWMQDDVLYGLYNKVHFDQDANALEALRQIYEGEHGEIPTSYVEGPTWYDKAKDLPVSEGKIKRQHKMKITQRRLKQIIREEVQKVTEASQADIDDWMENRGKRARYIVGNTGFDDLAAAKRQAHADLRDQTGDGQVLDLEGGGHGAGEVVYDARSGK